MKKSIAILILFLYFSISEAASIKGKVTCNATPVEFAAIGIDKLKLGTNSDVNGDFYLNNLPAGEHTLTVTCIGYIKHVQKINIATTDSVLKINIELKKNDKDLDEVVVTGTMKETYSTLSPVKVEVYTPALFKKNPTPNLFDAMNMVNGVQPQINCNVCNTGDIHINGMEGPYTMITIDGMPIVSSLSTVYGLSGIPNSLVQRIEVVKGPASTIYGSEAVAGLINVITKDPSQAPRLSLDVMSTSQWENNIDLGLTLKRKKVNALLGVNYFKFNNKLDINNDNFTDITIQDRISIFNKWSFIRKNNRAASVAARFVYEDRWGGELNWNANYRGSDSIYGENIYTTRHELIGNYQLPFDKEKIFFQYSLNSHHQNSVYGTNWFIATQNIGFGQLLWDKKIGSRNDLLIGTPFRYTYYDDNTVGTSISDQGIVYNKPKHTYLPGVFIQNEFTISEKATMLTGVRYEYNSDHGNILSPRLGFKILPINNLTVRLNGGNGYRVVNLFTEDHAALTGSRQVVIKNSLKPERSWNGNLNVQLLKPFKNGFIKSDISIFYTYFTNKIVGDFISDPNKIIYDNINGHAVSRGVSCNFDISLTNGFKGVLGATWMNVFNTDSAGVKTPQLHAPPFSGNYTLSYTFKKQKLSIDLTGKVTSPMPLPVVANDYRPDHSPWFCIMNIQLTKQIKNNIELYAGVKNLLNFTPKDPLLRPFDPFDKTANDPVNNPYGYTFDTTYNYAPMQGIRMFFGMRININ